MLPSTLSFSMPLLLGIILVMTSPSWFGIWLGLELNLLAFIPIIMFSNTSTSTETTLKYFFIQAAASLVIITSMLFLLESPLLMSLTTLFALLMKCGAAPLHFWFPQISEGLEWGCLLSLMTIQKLAPLCLLSYMMHKNTITFITLMAMLSGLIGALGGINETSIRKLLSFSSINHIGWLLLALLLPSHLWLPYYLIYCLILMSLIFPLAKMQIYHLSQMIKSKYSMKTLMAISLALLSMGGLPPLLGFFPKWLIISQTMNSQLMTATLTMVLLSVITLYYYMRLNITTFMMISTSTALPKPALNPSTWYTFIINLGGTVLFLYLWSISLLQ